MRFRFLAYPSAQLLICAAAVAGPYQITSMTVTDLNQAPYTGSIASGINDAGDIVGRAHNANGTDTVFVYRNGQMQVVPGAAGATGTPFDSVINNSGTIVGIMYNTSPPGNGVYYLSGQPAFQYLKTDVAGLPNYWLTYPYAINDSGQIAGFAIKKAGVQQPQPGPPFCYHRLPILWSSPTASPNGLFCLSDPDGDGQIGGYAGAYDINNSGHTVGVDAGSSLHSMFLFRDGVSTAVPRPATRPEFDAMNKPVPGIAYGINDQDWVVGGYDINQYGGNHGFAFVWDGVSALSMHLGALNGGAWSRAAKINGSAMVVGSSELRGLNGSPVAIAGFIWHMDFGMVQLPALKYFHGFPADCEAVAINERSWLGYVQIAGYCRAATGQELHAVRWSLRIVHS